MDQEKRFQELVEKKKTAKLEGKDWKEYKALLKKFGTRSTEFKPGNDFAWWNRYAELMRDAANLKCNWIAGTPLISEGNSVLRIPGVIKFKMYNTYGSENDITGPVNLAARNTYLKMFQKYRGVTAYNAPDLGITFIATLEVFQLVAKLERIYGVINKYDMLNRNAPRVLTQALGISDADADYIRSHLSDYRYDLNNIILKAQRILLPKDMSIFLDRISLYGYIYKDHQSARAQYVVFDYDHYGVFDETSLSTGGCVRFEPASYWNISLINTTNDGKTMFPVLNKLVEALLGSESVQKMYGDMLAYFGQDQMVIMLPLAENYVVDAVYSESILHKIHNAECIRSIYNTATPTYLRAGWNANMSADDISVLKSFTHQCIYQFNNVIINKHSVYTSGSNNEFTNGGYGYKGSSTRIVNGMLYNGTHVLDAYVEDFKDETVVEGVLWKPLMNEVSRSTTSPAHYDVILVSCGPEVIESFEIYTDSPSTTITPVTGTTFVISASSFIYKLFCLDWAPLIFQVNISGDVANYNDVFGDVDNARATSSNDIRRIQECAVLSSFRTDIVVINK